MGALEMMKLRQAPWPVGFKMVTIPLCLLVTALEGGTASTENSPIKAPRLLRKRPPNLSAPPYAVSMEPVFKYSQRDPLYEKAAAAAASARRNKTVEISSKADHDVESTKKVSKRMPPHHPGRFRRPPPNRHQPYHPPIQEHHPPIQEHHHPQYYPEPPEPIIEIIIKESNISLPPPTTVPPPPSTKEPIHVFYVKYKKNPNPSKYGDDIIYEKPIPALTPHETDIVEGGETEPHYGPTYAEPVATPNPLQTTTIRTIIRPDSELYQGPSGLKVTFGSPEHDYHQHESAYGQTANHPQVAYPEEKEDSIENDEEATEEVKHTYAKRQQPFLNNQERPDAFSDPNQPQFRRFPAQESHHYFERIGLAQRPQPQIIPTQQQQPFPNQYTPQFEPTHQQQQRRPTQSTVTDEQIREYQKHKEFLLKQQALQNKLSAQDAFQQRTKIPQQTNGGVVGSQSNVEPRQPIQVPTTVGPFQSIPQQRIKIYQQTSGRIGPSIQVPTTVGSVQNIPQQHGKFPQQPSVGIEEGRQSHAELRPSIQVSQNIPQQRSKIPTQGQPSPSPPQPIIQQPLNIHVEQSPIIDQSQLSPQIASFLNPLSTPKPTNHRFPQNTERFNPQRSTVTPSEGRNPNTEIIQSVSSLEEHQIQADFHSQRFPFQGTTNPSQRLQNLQSQAIQRLKSQLQVKTDQKEPVFTRYNVRADADGQQTKETGGQADLSKYLTVYSRPQNAGNRKTPSKAPLTTSTTPPQTELTSSVSTSKQEEDAETPEEQERKKTNIAALPEEVPEDLREQLLSSGILGNADIQILDYDKVGDIPIESLPPEALENFYGAASDPVPSVVKPDKDPQTVDMRVVRYDPLSEEITNKYFHENATKIDPVFLNDSKYKRYLPLKVSGTQFPIPDIPLLKDKTVNSVVVLAPVDYDFIKPQGEADPGRRGRVIQIQGVKFLVGDSLMTVIKSPTSDNFKKWLKSEMAVPTEQQSVILLVTKGKEAKEEIWMYETEHGGVRKLRGELSSAFVELAGSNSESEDLERLGGEPQGSVAVRRR